MNDNLLGQKINYNAENEMITEWIGVENYTGECDDVINGFKFDHDSMMYAISL